MNENCGRRKAYSYLRFSAPEQAKGDSFRRQASLAVEYANRHNLDLDDALSFHDLGVSAYHGLNAETGQLGALLEAVRVGLIPDRSVILVESLDRISRQAARKALRVIESILETGVSVVTLSDGREYTIESLDSDPISLLMALLTFIRANEESVTKSRRIAAAWESKRERAHECPLTSRLPGWIRLLPDKRTLELIPEQAAIVQRIYNETLSGRGALSIVRLMNVEGIPLSGAGGPKGKMWYSGTISKLLKNPAVIGTMTPCKYVHVNGKVRRIPLEPVPNYFPAVISNEDFERVQSMRNASLSLTASKRAVFPVYNVLAGLSRCSSCGTRMSLVSKSERGHYLVCRKAYARAGCKFKSVRYREVETTIVNRIKDLLSVAPLPRSPTIDRRFHDLLNIVCEPTLRREALNSAFRVLFIAVVIAPDHGTLDFNWRHGGISTMHLAFTTTAAREYSLRKI